MLWRLACMLPPLATPLEDKPPAPERVEPNVPLLATPLREISLPPPAPPPLAALPPPPPRPPPPPPLPPPPRASISATMNTSIKNSANHVICCIRVMDFMGVLLSYSSAVPRPQEPACGRRTRSSSCL